MKLMNKKPNKQKPDKKIKPGPEEIRLVIEGDPESALNSLLADKKDEVKPDEEKDTD